MDTVDKVDPRKECRRRRRSGPRAAGDRAAGPPSGLADSRGRGQHSGTVAQWHNGTVAQWHSGTVAQWHSGGAVAAGRSPVVGLRSMYVVARCEAVRSDPCSPSLGDSRTAQNCSAIRA
eukprot:6361943-Pyramimonas_sp.AAC.3